MTNRRVRWNKLDIIMFAYACISNLQNTSYADDALTPTSSIADGQELISPGQNFSLGFFTPGASKSRYIGIWYKNITPQTIVWVANRDNPLNDSRGNLTIAADGNIVLFDGAGNRIWFTNSSRSIEEPIAKLLDSGNFVLMDGKKHDSKGYIWQSFDNPTDTMLPGLMLGWDKNLGINRYLTSWKSANDPSPGNFTYRFDQIEFPELVIRQGTNITFRSGIWDGIRFNSDDWLSFIGITAFKPQLSVNSTVAVYWDEPGDRLSRYVMKDDGLLQRYIWDNKNFKWTPMHEARKDFCDNYGACGVNGICNMKDIPAYCDCLKGFTPHSPEDWDSFNWSGGCIRRTPLNCTQADRFQKLSWVKLPMLLQFWTNESMNLEECKVECLKNCSCTAYANSAVNEGPHGCLLWFGDLTDIRQLINEEGVQLDLYLRLAASEIESTANASKRKNIALIISVPVALLLCCIIFYLSKKYIKGRTSTSSVTVTSHRNQNEDQASPIFDIDTILAATNNFSIENKIGEGGFGPVYRGKLANGQEIAVKRLSKTSKQGISEFMNEVGLVAKLQHRNLVSVLGGCTQREERMLIYEYMPNSSLDHFIFDPIQGKFLNWRKRYEIVIGIARGLLYLHQDSKLTIIHRDLKTSNILLDSQLNPKISDFGVARIVEGDHSSITTEEIAGTIGYMPHEYAVNGILSLKSDVYSFGVIVLEILSGIRSSHYKVKHPDDDHNLLGQAWTSWKDGRAVGFMDINLDLRVVPSELLRCLQVGLLCVQKLPEDRPTMSSVVFMLSNESIVLPQPKKTGFFEQESEYHHAYSENESFSNNAMTITLLEARS
ncbi:G-type lectin S-receptor-like serine/threonine-protein kinase At4g27290 isoform X2 [Vigna radiata var. radiata]|uniref:Receptor-like serine/threonine-protein kinase n=1 Tax=Vigna radiata var. radiata TaxID=3916 RepID=A0A3Q0FK37_VIGRR|nr:G-type lectin S-receptor-like serine/threonine-protein kinase At4g27290 isoform X2 [Vigna radiata var. radiata]